MNNNKLILSIHFIKGNRGNLVFKKDRENGGYVSFRINRVMDALGFVGCMKQLVMGIAWEGEQDCIYELWNDRGRLWSLYCWADDGVVSIAVEDCQNFEEVFEWAGTVEGFRNAVEGMMERMGRYAFFV